MDGVPTAMLALEAFDIFILRLGEELACQLSSPLR